MICNAILLPYLVYQRYIKLKKNIELGEKDNIERINAMMRYGGTNENIIMITIGIIIIVLVVLYFTIYCFSNAIPHF